MSGPLLEVRDTFMGTQTVLYVKSLFFGGEGQVLFPSGPVLWDVSEMSHAGKGLTFTRGCPSSHPAVTCHPTPNPGGLSHQKGHIMCCV